MLCNKGLCGYVEEAQVTVTTKAGDEVDFAQ